MNRLMAALQTGDGAEHAVLEPPPGQFGEKALHRVEPGARGWREMEDPARMAGEPGADLCVLMGGIIVEDGMDDFAGRDRPLDGVPKTNEVLMPVALNVLCDNLCVERSQRREQRGCSMAFIIM